MSANFVVAEGREFTYPADAESLKIVTKAGGHSQLTDNQKEQVKYKTVRSGEDCSDMPLASLEIYLQRGWIVDTSIVNTPPIEESPVSENIVTDAGVTNG